MEFVAEMREADDGLLSDYSDTTDDYGPVWDRSSVSSSLQTDSLSLIDRYLRNVGQCHEHPPNVVGELERFTRKRVIASAETLALAKAARKCSRNTILAGLCLHYVAVTSDNSHGKCTHSAKRIADYLGCNENTVRDVRDELVKSDCLRIEPRPGQAAAVWLPYAEAAMEMTEFSILAVIAPARDGPGRPRKTSQTGGITSGTTRPTLSAKTPGTIDLPILEKPRVLAAKTPGIGAENPGHLMPDCNNSQQKLIASSHAGQRPQLDSLFTAEQIADWRKVHGSAGIPGIEDLLAVELEIAWPLCSGNSSVLQSAALATLADAKRSRPTSLQGFLRTVLRSQIGKLVASRQSGATSSRKRKLSRWGQ